MQNEPYYCLYLTRENMLTVVTLQWFDELDYDQERFMKDGDGDRYQFSTQAEAAKWLRENVQEQYIDPEYRGVGNWSRFLKSRA